MTMHGCFIIGGGFLVRIRSTLIAVAAILITLFNFQAVSAQSDTSRSANHNGEIQNDSANTYSIPVRIITTPDDQKNADDARQREQREEDRSKENISIQKDLAHYSALNYDLSFWSVVGLALTVIFTAATAVSAWLSVREAKKATQAAWASVKLSENYNKSHLRAYIVPYSTVVLSNSHDKALTIVVIVKNCGQTPCTVYSVDMQSYQTMPNFTPHEIGDFISHDYSAIVGAQGEKKIYLSEVFDEADYVEKFNRNKTSLHVYIKVKYRDIFDTSHETSFFRTLNSDTEKITDEFTHNLTYNDTFT
ncbi:hypothetical protein [Ochrobactrum sp. SFR4]|uniref:hypothetical protein n=1 Tax=Ochrobactrum sp. SFR4 TaxID=2717368 RepID=UPI001C8B51C1|nr:hypothetical protein [Ochrobactrum sp. SFR4]MBX8827266.1 hypothetical protein [Ochrobactrum sp. SFR4]